MSRAFLARDGQRTKLDYSLDGINLTKLWEQRREGLLETTFDSGGAIIRQQLVKAKGPETEGRISDFIKQSKITDLKERKYESIRLNKPCPRCGTDSLTRYVEAFSTSKEIPVMPLYYCPNCKGKSFSLTDAYLEYLVHNNKELFGEKELAELDRNSASFIKELHEYIIRIFASKRIMQIK